MGGYRIGLVFAVAAGAWAMGGTASAAPLQPRSDMPPGSGHYHCTMRQAAPPDPAATNGASPYNPGSLLSHAKHTANIVDAMNHCHVHEIPYAVYLPVAQAVHNPAHAPQAVPQALQRESTMLAATSGEANGTLAPLTAAQTSELGRLTGH